ncbi:MAG: hypothetical protein WBQ60_10375 [Asticcacaulis sp.]
MIKLPKSIITTWNRNNFLNFYDGLEQEKELWQQALSLRLYFSFRSIHLTKIMCAKWDDICLVDIYRRSNRVIIRRAKLLRYGQGEFDYNEISNEQEAIIEKIGLLGRHVSEKPYFLFPSQLGSKLGSITSVNYYWRAYLSDLDIEYVSPLHFQRLYERRDRELHWSADEAAKKLNLYRKQSNKT